MTFNWTDVRYWEARNDNFKFGYTVKPQQDGKFHAVKVKNGQTVRDIPCGRRKIAKARAYRWYDKRVQTLRNQQDAANLRIEMKERVKPKLTETEKKILKLRKEIMNAQKRTKDLHRVVKLCRKREMNAWTRLEQWKKKEQKLSKQLQEMESSEDGRVTAFVKGFK